jgi:tetratricopeptide (TPR) repeat protein
MPATSAARATSLRRYSSGPSGPRAPSPWRCTATGCSRCGRAPWRSPRARNQAALEAAQAVGDPEALALAHLGLSRVAFEDGDYKRALAQARAAREHARDLQTALDQGPLHTEAQSTRMLGDLDRAADLLAESLALNRRIGDTGMVAVELHNLGHVEIRRGNVEAVERIFDELGAGDDAQSTLSGAALAHARGDDHRARELFARAELVRGELAADDRAELDWLREHLRKPNSPAT